MQETKLKLPVPPQLFPVTYTNGPGLRYVIWVQGCSIRCCTHCLNPGLQDPDKGISTTAAELLEHIGQLKNEFSIEGLTFLGGEPMDQAAGLALLAREVQESLLSVMSYTGHTVETLLQKKTKNGAIRELLEYTDILVEGNYDHGLDLRGTLWRGSINQRIILLSPRYTVDRLKHTIDTTSQCVAGKVDIIENYFGNTLIRYHWEESIPLLQGERGPGLPQTKEFEMLQSSGYTMVSWIPELAEDGSAAASLTSPKGLCGVVDPNNNLHLYGFQKPGVVENFKKALENQGIRLTFEEAGYA